MYCDGERLSLDPAGVSRELVGDGVAKLLRPVNAKLAGNPRAEAEIGALRGKSMAMQLGVIGLGRMGGNIARRLMRGGHECVVWNRTDAPVKALVAEGATGASSLEDL